MENIDHEFYELLKREIPEDTLGMCIPDNELIALVLSRCELLRFPKNYRFIDKNSVANCLYFHKSGTSRVSYYEGEQEITIGIVKEPSVCISLFGFTLNQKAHYMFTTCSPVEVYRLSKEDFDSILNEYPGFSRWMMSLVLAQMATLEFKSKNLCGTTKDKYKSLLSKDYIKKMDSLSYGNFPDFSKDVTNRVIASYLDVNPAYLSSIKRELIEEERAGKK